MAKLKLEVIESGIFSTESNKVIDFVNSKKIKVVSIVYVGNKYQVYYY